MPRELFRMHVRLVQYIPIRSTDEFSLEAAQNYMQSLERDNKSYKPIKTKLIVHTHGMELEQGSWLPASLPHGIVKFMHFSQVRKYITFRSRMQILLLGIVSQASLAERGFMFLFTKSALDTKSICDAIERYEMEVTASKAHENSTLSLTSVEVEQHEETLCQTQLNHEIKSRSTEDGNSEVESTKSSIYKEERVQHSQKMLEEEESEISAEDSPWEIDIKYINYDPNLGNYIDDQGPVYMYTAHQIIPSRRRKEVFSCETSSSDGDHVAKAADKNDTTIPSIRWPESAEYVNGTSHRVSNHTKVLTRMDLPNEPPVFKPFARIPLDD